MNRQEWILKRNCSLSPRQLAGAYAALSVASFTIAMLFALRGAWHVLAFALLELFALALAFLHYARHATDHEYIVLSDGCLSVGCVCGGKVRFLSLNSCWTKIVLPAYYGALIRIEAQGVLIEVGRFVTVAQRKRIAEEIRQQLGNGMLMPAAA